MSKPCLRLSLLGFSEAQEQAILARMRGPRPGLSWERVTEAAEADALWIRAEAAERIRDGVVRVGGPDGAAIVVDLADTLRPVFLAAPVHDARLQMLGRVFDARSATSVEASLREAERRLQPLALQLVLAHAVAARLPRLTAPAYRVTRWGRLRAVLTVGGAVGIAPRQTLRGLAKAHWHALSAAPGIPPALRRASFAEVMWTYMNRADVDLLPRRYRTLPIHFRAMPLVPPRLQGMAHRAVFAQILAGPRTFAQLQASLGLRSKVLANALAALYLAGAITTDPAKAGAPSAQGDDSSWPPDDPRPFSAFADLEPPGS